VTFQSGRYEMIHTMYSLALSDLFCQITSLEIGSLSYERLYEDLMETINSLHRHGPVKESILKEPDKYILIDKKYVDTLLMLKSFGKRLILITNSDWTYTKSIMPFCYDTFLTGGKTWRDLFDLVIVDAVKPDFFTAQNPYYEVVSENGHLLKTLREIRRDRVYQGGNANAIERLFGVPSGQILYVGDHIYSDVYHSKKISHWRTMLVISELEMELSAAAEADQSLREIKEQMTVKEELELELDNVKKREIAEGAESRHLTGEEERIRGAIQGIDGKVGGLIETLNARFNPNWGELLFAGNDKSYFFMAIQRYACTYTSRVSNLLHYSPVHYFRPPIKSYELT